MDNITEIVYGNSMYYTINKSKLNKHKIIMFNTYFSIASLEDIDNYKITVPKYFLDDNIYDFSKEMKELDDSVNCNHKIRIWCSRDDINSYMLMLFITNYLKDKECNLYVIYSDEYDKKYNQSPALFKEKELEELSHYEHKLTKYDFIKLSDVWNDIKNVKCDLRVMVNKEISLVSLNYFDKLILDELRELGNVSIMKLVGNLIEKYYLSDIIWSFLIEILIDKEQIIITNIGNRFFENIISIKK